MQGLSITPNILITGQPSSTDLAELRANGFVGVVNLRQDGEPEQPIGVVQEGEIVRGEGLDYLHLAVGSSPLTADGVASVSRFLDDHADGKVLVHCRRGGRAVALFLLHLASKEGWPADQVFARGEAIGLRVDGAGLRNLVSAYLESQSGG